MTMAVSSLLQKIIFTVVGWAVALEVGGWQYPYPCATRTEKGGLQSTAVLTGQWLHSPNHLILLNISFSQSFHWS